jgi:hypothetical protein
MVQDRPPPLPYLLDPEYSTSSFDIALLWTIIPQCWNLIVTSIQSPCATRESPQKLFVVWTTGTSATTRVQQPLGRYAASQCRWCPVDLSPALSSTGTFGSSWCITGGLLL